MDIVQATNKYEAWLGRQIRLIPADLESKHAAMSNEEFPFFRATFYRWAQIWREVCGHVSKAPLTLAVGDLHVENFGTWRDADGRLVWGINDFDEAWRLPYTSDLVRLATSAGLASGLRVSRKRACSAILEGYRASLRAGGQPLVLAEKYLELRAMAVERLKDPGTFWRKMDRLPDWEGKVPKSVLKSLARMMPERGIQFRVVHRIAGLGSLGRERFVAIATWRGSEVAREAKALTVSACAFAQGRTDEDNVYYEQMLAQAVRCPDPFVNPQGGWILRRLAPDCSRIELADLPRAKNEERLLYYMGWETANVHLGGAKSKDILAHLDEQKGGWLERAATRMVKATRVDWKHWRQARKKRPAPGRKAGR